MNKAIEAARVLTKTPESNHLDYLKECNLFNCFEDIYKLNINVSTANLMSAYLIYAYDPDSLKLDIRKDRWENKVEILLSLGVDTNIEIVQQILSNESEEFNNCVLHFLEKLTNWRWPTIYSLLDYHSNMIRFANQKTEEEKSFDKMNKEGEVKTLSQSYDIDTIAKVNIQKSDIFKRAIEARENADKLLEDIRKEFMPTDTVTQQDFGFTFTETSKKKVNVLSWREFIKGLNDKKAATIN
jgi:hypothetical protein